MVLAKDVSRLREPESGGQRRTAVSCFEMIERTFRSFRKPADASPCPERCETVAPARQDFVRIHLMPDIKNDFVRSRIELAKKSDGQFNGSKGRSKVSAVSGDDRYDEFPHVFGNLFDGFPRKVCEIPVRRIFFEQIHSLSSSFRTFPGHSVMAMRQMRRQVLKEANIVAAA